MPSANGPYRKRLVKATPCCGALSAIADHAIVRGSRSGARAVSSAVEHYLDMVGVTGSIPVLPTNLDDVESSRACRPAFRARVSWICTRIPARASHRTHDQHLPRIHDVQRIERGLDLVHQRHLDGILVTRQHVALQLADAVLGADRSSDHMHAVVHQRVHVVLAREQFLFRPAFAGRDVVMKIPVAEVSEDHVADARECRPQRRVGARTNSAIRETGIDTSCLMLLPVSFSAIGMLSRRCHSAWLCASDPAITASFTSPASIASPTTTSKRSRACASD